MPIILARIMEGRSQEKIDAFIEAVTEAAHKTLDAPRESVRVLVEEMPKSHWGIGGKSAKSLGR